jgi:energy-coupling factor transporter transmembrane protein EcfT
MQDPRLRILATLALSAAAFLSVSGAVLALLWWLICTGNVRALPHRKALFAAVLMIAAASAVSELSGGAGVSYFIRMTAILVVAAWAYHDRREGELLDVSVWLFGNRLGFDLGLVAEMSLQTLEVIFRDLKELQTALRIKGIRPGVRTIGALAANLIIGQIRRTEGQAKLLTVRGYESGGHICPKFRTDTADILKTAAAGILVFSALIPVGDVFIVIQ